MKRRALPLYLPTDTYRRLEIVACDEERTPFQQAAYFIREALERRAGLLSASSNTLAVADTAAS